MRKKGFAIILVLATLVLLALLSITYIKLALIDRNIARNYMDNKRARLIAQSGVDYATGRLNEIFSTDGPFSTDWTYNSSKASFESGIIKINSLDQSFTTSIGGTYSKNSDVVITKVKDLNSLINVNDGLSDKRVSGNLKRIITNLARHPDVIGATAPDIGKDIIESRPATGFASINEIKKVLDEKYPGAGYYEKISQFLTCYAWKDNNIANPVPISKEAISGYTNYCDGYSSYSSEINVYRFNRGKQGVDGKLVYFWYPKYYLVFQPEFNAFISTTALPPEVYALDELSPQWIQIASRSPININLAREEILYALIKDLKGFFVLEGRDFGAGKPTVLTGGGPSYSYIAGSNAGAMGISISTESISEQDARNIAREIIKCRDKQDEYATKFFGGLFKTWRQFNAFCDYLTTKPDPVDPSKTIISDNRALSYFSEANPPPLNRPIAIKAKADVLKANFNPNLHLDESNPDANIRTLVDKTDLIVNSTEFCFTPMGYFEVESKGFVLKAQDSDDSLSATDNKIIAEAVIQTSFKLFDAARYSTQKDFLSHINAATDIASFIGSSATNTNNSRTIEIGPEPSCDINFINLAKQNEWGGYIALPSLKGPDKVIAKGQNPGTLETIISHFTTNFSADYHIDGLNTNYTAYNLSDPGETVKGPYTYGFTGASGRPSTLAKSFRGTGIFSKYAWPDLRIDGAYVERFATIAYDFAKTKTLTSKVLKDRAVISYWIKPWFIPENAAKIRGFFNETHAGDYIFGHWFISQNGSPTETVAPEYDLGHSLPYFYPTSMVFGCSSTEVPKYATSESYEGSGGNTVVNHKGHPHAPGINTFLQAQWMHVTLVCDLSPTSAALNVTDLLINGARPPDHIKLPLNVFTDGTVFTRDAEMRFLLANPYAKIKIGSAFVQFRTDITSEEASGSAGSTVPDSTVDEFYIYAADTDLEHQENINRAKSVYTQGRYYKPISDESYFKSNLLDLSSNKYLSAKSTIPSPSPDTGSAISLSNQPVTILGLSWTWYAEDMDDAGRPILKNYKNYYTGPYPVIYPKIKVKLIKNSSEYEYVADSYSSVNLILNSSDTIRYKVIIKLEKEDGTWTSTDADDLVLLYTPVFDDITIYYSQGPVFLSYNNAE